MKNLDWGQLTDDLLETLVLNQRSLAEKCRVTQQSVSNWKTGIRNPGVYARHALRELSKEANLQLEDYKVAEEANPVSVDGVKLSSNVADFALKLNDASAQQQAKIIEMAEFVLAKGE